MSQIPTTALPTSAAHVTVQPAVQPAILGRLLELLGLFVLVPLLLRWHVVAAPRLLVLALVTAGCVAVLWKDPTFDRRRLVSVRGLRASLGTIALRGGLAAVTLLGLTLVLKSTAEGALPADRATWIAGLALYPFLSAWPQEVLYRVFFFHRYAKLLGSEHALLGANALAFGALHLVYPNLVAPLLSIPAGLLLALTYRRTKSMGPVWIEHTVYGFLLFSLGLGAFFFDGRP